MTAGPFDDLGAGGAERGLLGRGGARLAGDDGAGVAHAAAGRGRSAGDEADHGLGYPRLNEGRGVLLLGAADLADHHDSVRLGVVLEELEDIDEGGPDDGVAADADARRLSKAVFGELRHGFVGGAWPLRETTPTVPAL